MEVKNFLLTDIKPYDKNPRKNSRAIDAVAKSIAEFGFKIPIVIDADNVIVCGHTRYEAAQKLGLDNVPCIVVDDLTPEQVKAFRLVANKTEELTPWDFDSLDEELAEIPYDMHEFGFMYHNAIDIDDLFVPMDSSITVLGKKRSRQMARRASRENLLGGRYNLFNPAESGS